MNTYEQFNNMDNVVGYHINLNDNKESYSPYDNIESEEIRDVKDNYMDILQDLIKQSHYNKQEENIIDIVDDDINEMFISDFTKKYRKALKYIRETGRCNHWALKQHLHIGDKFANDILSKMKNDGIISKDKVGKNYEILKKDGE